MLLIYLTESYFDPFQVFPYTPMAILFLNDWLKYPDAIIHTTTRNKSALELAAKLRIMGVKNHAFFLALHNPNLASVDPFSPDLTQQQMLEIGIEIKTNPWYYFREIAMAPAIAGTEANMMELNRANVALWWCFALHVFITLTQPRQTGKSFSVDHQSQYLYNFRCNNTQINLLTKDEKLRAENIKRLKDIYEELPAYLKFKTREDANNTEEISIKRLGNTYKTHVPNASPKRAHNIGRGMTTPIFLIDEPPFQPNIDLALPAALAAMGAAVDAAKRNDEPYGVVLTTTAGKKDEKEGAYIYGIIEKSALWSDMFYDAVDAKDFERMVRSNCRGGFFRIYMAFSHIQLGKTDEWLKEKLELTGATGDAANRDFFNVWTSGTQSSPLPTHITELITKSITDWLHQTISPMGGYVLRWYIPENQIENYMLNNDVVVGIDTSDASGGDDISLVATDVKTGSVVAAGSFNETNLITFAKFLVTFMIKWKRTTFIIERRSSGATILDYLLLFLPTHGIDPFKRLFNWVVNDPQEYKERAAEMHAPMYRRSEETYTRSKKYFGFATSGGGQTSRSELYSTTLLNAAKRCTETIKDRQLSGQITGLVTRNGRVDHEIGAHDDLVIGWLLCHWLLTMGKNLAHYGIDPKQILISAIKEKPMSSEEQLQRHMQLQVRQRINTLFELMSQEGNEYLLGRYEQELRQLDRQLVLQEGENFSLDAFLNEIKEKKKQIRARPTGSANAQDYIKQFGYSDGRTVNSRLAPGTIVL